MRRMDIAERRARLARRHHLHPSTPATDIVAAADRLVGLHATDPATVFLAAQARVPDFVVADGERAMYEDRTLLRHLCMRRTMFALPTTLVPVVQAACTDAVAATQRRRLIADVERGGVADDGAAWLRRAERDTMAALDAAGEATGAQLSRAVPALRASITYAEGRSWGGPVGVATRVFTVMAAEGRIVRGRPNGTWTSSQHRWIPVPAEARTLIDEAVAVAELVRRWLAVFGPATLEDIVWWTGLGVGKVRSGLVGLDTVAVDVDGAPGLVLADDSDPEPPIEPWAAALPALDPTTMGWKHRSWYLGAHGDALFDRTGNAGPTLWWDGRIVGGWGQRPGGRVVIRLLEDVGATGTGAIEDCAARLEAWLGGTVVMPRFPTPLQRELATE